MLHKINWRKCRHYYCSFTAFTMGTHGRRTCQKYLMWACLCPFRHKEKKEYTRDDTADKYCMGFSRPHHPLRVVLLGFKRNSIYSTRSATKVCVRACTSEWVLFLLRYVLMYPQASKYFENIWSCPRVLLNLKSKLNMVLFTSILESSKYLCNPSSYIKCPMMPPYLWLHPWL